MMRSTAGAVTQRARRTTGPLTKKGPDVTEILAMSRRDGLEQPAHGVSIGEAFRVWLRVAALSFGGPAGQIAVMHRILVEEKRWVSESRFMHALNYCMLLPGPEAQQLATYIGWLMHRTRGGIIAGGLFILPGIVALMALSIVYAEWGQVGFVAAAFFGLKAAVLAIVVEAVIRIGRRSLTKQDLAGIGGGGFRGDLLLRRPVSRHHHCGWPDRASSARALATRPSCAESLTAKRKPNSDEREPAWRSHPRPRAPVEIAARLGVAAFWLALVARARGGRCRRCREPATSLRRSRCSSARWRW